MKIYEYDPKEIEIFIDGRKMIMVNDFNLDCKNCSSDIVNRDSMELSFTFRLKLKFWSRIKIKLWKLKWILIFNTWLNYSKIDTFLYLWHNLIVYIKE